MEPPRLLSPDGLRMVGFLSYHCLVLYSTLLILSRVVDKEVRPQEIYLRSDLGHTTTHTHYCALVLPHSHSVAAPLRGLHHLAEGAIMAVFVITGLIPKNQSHYLIAGFLY